MIKETQRFFGEALVNHAELLRNRGLNKEAAADASSVLKFDQPFSRQEIEEIINDGRKLRILAGMARIYVDAQKNVANRAVFPHEVLQRLTGAATIINSVYRNDAIQAALQDVTTDARGNLHRFKDEMPRDEIKVALAAEALFLGDDTFDTYAENRLYQTIHGMEADNPVRPLVMIELALYQLRKGKKVDEQEMVKSFQELVTTDINSNPDRVRVVAVWLIVAGVNYSLKEIFKAATDALEVLRIAADEKQRIIAEENSKQTKTKWRNRALGVAAKVFLPQEAKNKLKNMLVEKK